jgi:Flp pilus assembly pilin Flp
MSILTNITPRFATRRPGAERGQSTAEYALILVAIAAMVGLVISFLGGEGGGLITGLFGSVFDNISSIIPGIG